MRCLVLAALAASLLPATARSEEAPYEAYVVVDEAAVLAGPSRRFYATGTLGYGETVEVFRREPGGWLAIRQPAGSFSWVPAEQVEMTEKATARIVGDAVASWIGTSQERVREHKYHVQLKPGELVELLGKRTVETESGEPQVWLKIAPPAGEFRWVHSDDVSRDRPAEPEPDAAVELAAAAEPEEPSDPLPLPPRVLAPPRAAIKLSDIYEQPRSTIKQANYEPPAAAAIPASPAGDGFVARKRKRVEGPAPATTTPRGGITPADSPAGIRPAPRDPSTGPAKAFQRAAGSEDFSREFDAIEVDLALMLSQNKQLWNIAPLKQRVQDLIDNGPTAADRGQARLLRDKLLKVERTFDVPDLGTALSDAAGGDSDAPAPAAGSTAADPKYDGVGFLKPVLTQGKPVAPYALVDAEGNVRSYVSPSPGLNLNRYVNKEVGVYGRRGYVESLGATHLTAQRIIDLDRHRR